MIHLASMFLALVAFGLALTPGLLMVSGALACLVARPLVSFFGGVP